MYLVIFTFSGGGHLGLVLEFDLSSFGFASMAQRNPQDGHV